MLAYHVVVRAMEGRAGIKPVERLWLSLRHALDGHLPYERYQKAGFSRAREGARPSEVERWILDWLSTDLNPAGQIGRVACSVDALIAGYNVYNRRACLAVRTTMQVGRDDGTSRFDFKRDLLSSKVDPETCKLGTLTVFRRLLGETVARQGSGPGAPLWASQVARAVGAGATATAQVAEVFDAEGCVDIPTVARRLGCGLRALERKVREEGGTPEQIKLACRMTKAQSLLATGISLTEVALDAGFSDAAHMSRGFKRACGMTPSEMRAAILGDPIRGAAASAPRTI